MPARCYLGVDQTGAVNARGEPKLLAACFLQGEGLHLVSLPSFTPEALRAAQPRLEFEQLLISLDCVFGFPREITLPWRAAMLATREEAGFGRAPAARFFHRLGGGAIPRRPVEALAGCVSVFQEKPFQRNVQSGTFRFWREMAEAPDWFRVPWVEARESGVPVFEGFPSFAWRQLFGVKKREPHRLLELLPSLRPRVRWRKEQQALAERDPNFADALVLALQLRACEAELFQRRPSPEGWIVGVEET